MSIIKKILSFRKNKNKTLFTTPSHSQGEFIPKELEKILGKKYFKSDYSEIDGFDNLRNPTGIIKSVQDKIARIYGTKSSFMLTNGSTSGILASILALLNKGDKILVARNCHISVYNALVLSGAEPIWIQPEFDEEWGIFDAITPSEIEKNLTKIKNIKAVILTSPTYEGIFSDISNIAKICKKHKTTLIVDEAHGAILNFSKLKNKSAITCDADVIIQSLHKTAGAPNPCALLHIGKTSNINPELIQNALNLITTSSPSYPLLCAIEAATKYLATQDGTKKINKLYDNIEKLKNELKHKVKIYDKNNDPTKLLIKVKDADPEFISELLNEKYNIEEEYTNSRSLLFITGLGTTHKKLRKLYNALNNISKIECKRKDKKNNIVYPSPQLEYTPFEAKAKNIKEIDKIDSIGKICGEIIVNYPPGIPLLLPGEIITEEIINLLKRKKIKILI